MMKSKTDLQKANEERVRRGLPEVHVGFDYVKTIERICAHGRWIDGKGRQRRYKVPDVAACLGITPQAVHSILEGKGNRDLRHITAQLLVGLWKDAFNDPRLKSLPMSDEQRKGGWVKKISTAVEEKADSVTSG